jgi:hypothetical protein
LEQLDVYSYQRNSVKAAAKNARNAPAKMLGMHLYEWTASCDVFDHLPGVVIFEPGRIQIAERGGESGCCRPP